jgi:hypothetical protein
MEIELTSAREDAFTWRAAGARQPKGVVETSLLPSGAKVGDVVRVEAEVEIDGITILSVLPSKEKAPVKGRIEVLGTPRPTPGVTTVLAGPPGRGRRDERDGDRRGRPGGRERHGPDRGGRAGRSPGRDTREREPRLPAGADAPAGAESTGEGAGEARPAQRGPAGAGGRDSGRPGRGSGRPGGERRNGPGGTSERAGAGRSRAGERPDSAPARGSSPRRGPIRLEPGTKHRDELFAKLTPEERTIAERLATGGLPGLRRAISDEQARARQEGRPQVSGEPLIAIAERLMPDVHGATWLDRAEAVVDRVDDVSLRDLRTTVAGAAPRDEAGRDLERRLREALERRVTKLRSDWEEHLRQALEDGRVLQALRLSGRPPEPTARFPAALVAPLTSQASAAMTADTAPDRWLALLEAAVASPVRRQIKPDGVPKDENGQVEKQARLAAGRIPALAPLLGMAMPPPPQPLPGERVPRPGARPSARVPRFSRPARPPRPPQPGRSPQAAVWPSEPAPQPAEPAVVAPEPAGEAPEPAGEAPEPAVVAPEPAVVAPEPAGEAPAPAVEAPETAAASPEAEPSPPSPAIEAMLDEPVEQTGNEG